MSQSHADLYVAERKVCGRAHDNEDKADGEVVCGRKQESTNQLALQCGVAKCVR